MIRTALAATPVPRIGQIEKADAIVPAMTRKSVNVFFEIGIAGVSESMLCWLPPTSIPFDVAHGRHV